jgi:uncharacterized protein (TIGR00369 family)
LSRERAFSGKAHSVPRVMNLPHYGLVPLEEIVRRDGYEFLEAMRNGELPSPPIYETMGFRLKQVERGRVVVEGLPARRCYNPVGSVHAGFTSALLDAALTSSVQTVLPPGEIATPVEVKVNLVRPLLESTGPVDAIATVLYRGRTVATAEGKVVDAGGKLYAHATATCTIGSPTERSESD